MDGHVSVTLLETVVFADVVQVVATNHNGALHLRLDHDTAQNTTTNGHIAGERALLVDVVTIDRLVVEANGEQ